MTNKALSTERSRRSSQAAEETSADATSSGGNLQRQLLHYFSLNRRYSRSVNLERDLEQPDALEGYILTERSVDALRRILAGLGKEGASNAWTLTSVYGTGKSAFAHYLASLCASSKSKMRSLALEITGTALGAESPEYLAKVSNIPKQGYVRAVAVAQREPISHTVVRALLEGAKRFWNTTQDEKSEEDAVGEVTSPTSGGAVGRIAFAPSNAPSVRVISKLVDLKAEIDRGNKIDSKELLALVQEIAQASKTGVFLIIDELGKNLEYAAYERGAEDLYLLDISKI